MKNNIFKTTCILCKSLLHQFRQCNKTFVNINHATAIEKNQEQLAIRTPFERQKRKLNSSMLFNKISSFFESKNDDLSNH